MHLSLFTDRYFVQYRSKDSLELNNTINMMNIILYYFLSMDTCEYLNI